MPRHLAECIGPDQRVVDRFRETPAARQVLDRHPQASRDDVSTAPVRVDNQAQHTLCACRVARGNTVGDLAVSSIEHEYAVDAVATLGQPFRILDQRGAPARSIRASDWANIAT